MELLMTQLTGGGSRGGGGDIMVEDGRDGGGGGGKATAGGWGYVLGAPAYNWSARPPRKRRRGAGFVYLNMSCVWGTLLARPPGSPTAKLSPVPLSIFIYVYIYICRHTTTTTVSPHREIPRFCTRKINKQTLHVHYSVHTRAHTHAYKTSTNAHTNARKHQLYAVIYTHTHTCTGVHARTRCI